MDKDKRDLIDHLGAELAGVMEDASVDAALLRGVSPENLARTIDRLVAAAHHSLALARAMQAVASTP